MSNLFPLCITSLDSAKNTRYGYRVEVNLYGRSKEVIWPSEKQSVRLLDLVDRLKNGHSSKRAELVGVFERRDDGKLRFVWAGLHTPRKSDLPNLAERFGFDAALYESPYVGDTENRTLSPAMAGLED